MPDFFNEPANTPDPAGFLAGVEHEARRRHNRRAIVTGVSAAVVLAATGVTVGFAAVGSGPPTSSPVTVTDQPTASPSPSGGSPTPVESTGSPMPTPTPSVAVSSALPTDTSIRVYGDCQHPTFEPTEITEPCADHRVGVKDIIWSTWTSERATGVGTLWYYDCSPSCGNHYVPNTTVTLTEPKVGARGVLVWSMMLTNPQPPGWSTGPLHGAPFPLVTQPD